MIDYMIQEKVLIMNSTVKEDQWIWVIIQDPDKNEQILGQHDNEQEKSFIPFFLSKEDAQIGRDFLTREKGHRYEAQAILFEDLIQQAAQNGLEVYLLNDAGKILEKNIL